MNEYQSMKVFLNVGFYDSVEITYKDGKVETIKGFDEVVEKLVTFSEQTKMKIEDLLADESKVQYVNLEVKKEETKIDVEEETKEEPAEVVETDKEKEEVKEETTSVERHRRSEKNTTKKRRFLTPAVIKTAVGTVVAFMIIGGCELFKHSKYSPSKNNNKQDEYNNDFSVERHDGSANDNYNQILEPIYDNVTDYVNAGKKIIKNTAMTEQEFFEHLNNTNQMMFSGVEELIRFLNGSSMQGNIYNIALEDMFTPESNEYVAVHNFCAMRNRILNNAMHNQNPSQTRNEIQNFLREYTNFVYCAHSVNGYDFQYSDLDRMAKYVILGLGSAYSQIDVDFSLSANNIVYNRDILMSDSQNILNDIMMDWESHRVRK